MAFASRKLILFVAAVTAAAKVAVCQQPAEHRTITVCELLSSSLAYSGLRVHVTGRLEGFALFAAECSLDLYSNGRQWPVVILIDVDRLKAPWLRALQQESDTPYGPGSDVMVELAGTFETGRGGLGVSLGNIRSDRVYPAKLKDVALVSSRMERPKALSICEVLANTIRYHGQVIKIEGEHRWLGGDQILYDAACGPGGGAVLMPPEDNPEDRERPPADTPLGVLRASLEFIISLMSGPHTATWILKWDGITLSSIGPVDETDEFGPVNLLYNASLIDIDGDGLLEAVNSPGYLGQPV